MPVDGGRVSYSPIHSDPEVDFNSQEAYSFQGLSRAQLALGGLNYTDLLVAELSGQLQEQPLRVALYKIAVKYPVLRTRFSGVLADGYTVDPAPPQPLPLFVGEGTWEEAASFLLSCPLGGPRPAWRVELRRGPKSNFLLFAVHHALVDGPSLAMLLRELLIALEEPMGPSLPHPPTPLELAGLPAWTRVTRPALRLAWAHRIDAHQRNSPFQGRSLMPDKTPPTLFSARLPSPSSTFARGGCRGDVCQWCGGDPRPSGAGRSLGTGP